MSVVLPPFSPSLRIVSYVAVIEVQTEATYNFAKRPTGYPLSNCRVQPRCRQVGGKKEREKGYSKPHSTVLAAVTTKATSVAANQLYAARCAPPPSPGQPLPPTLSLGGLSL